MSYKTNTLQQLKDIAIEVLTEIYDRVDAIEELLADKETEIEELKEKLYEYGQEIGRQTAKAMFGE